MPDELMLIETEEAVGSSRVAARVYPSVRAPIHAIRPYVPGRPIADVQREFGLQDVVKLASNENPNGPSPLAMAAIRDMVGELHRYPDGAAQDIRAALAEHVGLTADSVMVSNGSDELIKMVSETFLAPGDEIITALPSFAQYAFGAAVMGAVTVEVPMREGFQYDLAGMLARITDRTKLIYLCTPNNPTGTWLNHTEVNAFIEQVPDHIVVICDEAYIEYVDSPDPVDSLQWIRAGKSVLSLRTFSKMYGLAGLRLGYALGDPGLIAFINQVREPFNANAVAQAAAVGALADTDFVRMVRAENQQGRLQYYEGLAHLGIPYVPTQGNFLLARVGDGMAVFTALQRVGVIVRAGFKGLDEYIRISIGTQADNARCLDALAHVMGK